MRKLILNILAVVVTAMTIFSCKDVRNSEVYRLLTDVDSYIESRPDSALAVLEGIDKAELTTNELEAKYALLMSMALDKNYIDLQSDSVIAPAVRYYERYGSADEKLKAFYYRGRVSMNANNYDEAMEYFSFAGKYRDCRQNRSKYSVDISVHSVRFIFLPDIRFIVSPTRSGISALRR